MHILRSKHALGLTLSVVAAGSVVIACANDFDAFEPGAGSSTTDAAIGADGPTGADGSTAPPKDGSVNPPTDGSTPNDAAPVDCTPKASCGATQTTCNSACDQTRTTCIAGCPSGGSGNKCKNDCSAARDSCTSQCHSTCRTCAGSGCSSVCN